MRDRIGCTSIYAQLATECREVNPFIYYDFIEIMLQIHAQVIIFILRAMYPRCQRDERRRDTW